MMTLFLVAAAAASAQQMKLERTVIKDPAVGDIEGATLLLPQGWKLEGGFVWMPLFSMQANLRIRVSDPATGASADTLPAQQFNWPTQDVGVQLQPGSNWNGSILWAPPRSPEDFVQGVLTVQTLPHLKGLKPTRTEDLPKVAAETAKLAPATFKTVSTRLRYGFEVNGKAWEEDVVVTLTFAPLNGWTAMWWCNGTSMRAPGGQLDQMLPLLSVPIQSIRVTLPWYAQLEEVRKVFSQGRLKSQEDFARFQQSWKVYQAQAQESHRKVWEERAASQDRQNAARREILGGVETYKNPYEARTLELPTGYRDCWVNAQGTVLLSNDAAYDPRPGSTHEWKRMEKAAP